MYSVCALSITASRAKSSFIDDDLMRTTILTLTVSCLLFGASGAAALLGGGVDDEKKELGRQKAMVNEQFKSRLERVLERE